MNMHEDLKRSLAQKATLGPWRWVDKRGWRQMVGADGRTVFDDGSAHGEYGVQMDNTESDTVYIAFHDPTTALLEADVIAAARKLRRYGTNGGYQQAICRREDAIVLSSALDALDAHHYKRSYVTARDKTSPEGANDGQ